MKKKYKIGYTQGVFDMFHIGHLNLLIAAKQYCDFLYVGVNSDQLVREYKHKDPVIPEETRRKIVENIKAVDEAVIVSTLDKLEILKTIPFDAVFIGSDWKNSPRWNQTEIELGKLGKTVEYLPYTQNISSSILRPSVNNSVDEKN